ncbi:hypothetical protein CEUSTIGMA_g7719.t1 [Chlamydomonas eustigma]|uniref:Uncharacterized protein n=1 Tax=Chlamydomonas eustigma TaxID=1157962 RepID=A0A250XB23_9CHLO|nr:hypothetical protein CEUSTIGMA_g7719.t1 [Chlamydomonas eustigma]|eukprot:GAX80281.1 hypothetical protein CEUSTIGMA_g7719.t1 [Chlamydomonas eustigma]
MAKAQVERWAMDHPTCPRTGHYFEIPLSQTMPRVFAVLATAGVLWWGARELLWYKRPDTLKPEFIEEAKKIGNVAQRMNAPPVFLNPFSNRIPGNISGPEDLASKE